MPEEYQQRVKIEFDALVIRIWKLERFIDAQDVYPNLDQEDKDLLGKQLEAMKTYAAILEKRIERFAPPDAETLEENQ